VNQLLRKATGVAVRLPDLLAVRVTDAKDVRALIPTSFELMGDDGRETGSVKVQVQDNGRVADVVVFALQPSVADNASQGTVAWAFGTHRPEEIGCAVCPSDLGLDAGQNQIVVTVSDASSGSVLGAAEAIVALRTGAGATAEPIRAATGKPQPATRSRSRAARARRR
jgi:hypothetical protein